MTDSPDSKLKVRWKFRSGEEFEAEGSRDFIENQRLYFLSLIGKQPSVQPVKASEGFSRDLNRSVIPATPTDSFDPYIPAVQRHMRKPETPALGLETTPLWERLIKTEEGIVVLRRKHRMLTPDSAGLLLIAAAKALLKADDGYSALNLSKSMKKSGYDEGRLDRVLLPELKAGAITSIGSKRSRAYKISDEGFARAFVLAEKLGEEH